MRPARALLAVASAAGVALAVRSALGDPVPVAVAIGALGGYLALVFAGALAPGLGMFADVVARGPRGARGVALTFDDGPHPVHTRAVLALLDRAGARATFFVLGAKAEAHPEVVRESAARGHLVALHGFAHDRWLALRSLARVRAELERGVAALAAITGERPRFYRPPVGQTNPRIARAAEDLGLTIVGWSARGRDGVRTTAARVVARVVPRLEDGAIVLLHDAAERDDRVPVAPAALPAILDAIAARQLDCVRVDDWLGEA